MVYLHNGQGRYFITIDSDSNYMQDFSTSGKMDYLIIVRLNSGIFMIFEPSERNLNLNASVSRASKIIPDDSKLEPISWELVFGNPVFNFCLGVGVGEQKIPDKACLLLGNGFEDRFGVRISLLLVLIGSAGIYVEITNAFEYVQGARNGFQPEFQADI